MLGMNGWLEKVQEKMWGEGTENLKPDSHFEEICHKMEQEQEVRTRNGYNIKGELISFWDWRSMHMECTELMRGCVSIKL